MLVSRLMTDGFPFPIPNGWFQVAYSDELEPGAVRPLHYFGKDLVLFRTRSGEASLLDAFCPHLGAHLGHGGLVEGEHIRCPFHAWEFDAQGSCQKVPYARRVPAKARIRAWPLCERNQILWAWHDASGRAPAWDVPEVPEMSQPDWGPPERHRWRIRSTPQEIGENGVDRAHFRYVHGTATVPDSELRLEGHIRHAIQHVTMNTPRGQAQGAIRVEAHGMGCTLTRFTGIFETVNLLSHTPIDHETVETRFTFVQPRAEQPGSGVGAALVAEVVRQMNQDIPIWEHKRYLPKPLLCDGDGPIAQYRQWASQFYG